MSDPLTKQQEETKKLGSSTRTGAHSKFAMAKKWLVIIVAVLIPLAVFMNFGWRAIIDFDFEDSRPVPARQVTQAAPRVVQPAVVTPPAAPRTPRIRRECPVGQFADAEAAGLIRWCEVVTLFKDGEPSFHSLGPDFCTFFTNSGSVRLVEIDDNNNGVPESYLLHHRSSGDIIETVVYRLNDGQSFRGNEC